MSENNPRIRTLVSNTILVITAVILFSLASYAGWDYALDKADGHCFGPICVGDNTPTNQGEHLE